MREVWFVKDEPEIVGLLHDPLERLVAQAGWHLAAANIGMHAGKPRLF